jgi:hypothetical protein
VFLAVRAAISLAVLQAANDTGETGFFVVLIVIAVILIAIFLGSKKKRLAEQAEFRQRLAEIQRERSPYQPQSIQLGNVIKPEVVALLQNTPADVGKGSEFDSSAVLQSAITLHNALASWMSMLRLGLKKAGTSEGDVTLQMTSLYSEIEQASKQYFPPIVSLVIASTLRGYVQYLTTEEGGLNCITAELAVTVISSLSTLEDQLLALLRDAGWNGEQITAQCNELSKKINTLLPKGVLPL